MWTVNREHELGRLIVDSTMVASCEERRDWWTMLRSIAGFEAAPQPKQDVEQTVRAEIARAAEVYVKRWKRYAAGLKRVG